jgi:hypothetical protein
MTNAQNSAALLSQLRNFATVGLCNAQPAELNPSISLGMTLAILCGIEKGEFS